MKNKLTWFEVSERCGCGAVVYFKLAGAVSDTDSNALKFACHKAMRAVGWILCSGDGEHRCPECAS